MEKVLLTIIAASGLCAVSSHVGRHYHFVYEAKTMTEALSYCREKYTDLASIHDLEDMKLLNERADRSRMVYTEYSNRAWIGLYDDVKSERWSLSDRSFYKPGEDEFRNWYPEEPNNRNSRGRCVMMNPGGTWFDYLCDRRFPSICCDVTGSNVTFILIPTTMNWTEAQSYCREHHTDLASVRNEAENQKIKKQVPSAGAAWIGLFRGSWKWTDGSDSSFRYWSQMEPDNLNGAETCVAANFGDSGRWEDWPCDRRRAFICSSVTPVYKKVIKVTLVKQNSSLDLNSAAVLEDLLKQFKQKLKDQGVSGDVKLSWRKQPDGNVFQKEEKKKKKKKIKRGPRLTRKTKF